MELHGRARVARLAAAEDFRRTYREGQRVADGLVVIYVRRTGLPVHRVGIAVGRGTGGAVQRNRIRRRVREAYRQLRLWAVAGTDLVIVPRPSVLRAPFAAVQDSLLRLLVRAGLPSVPPAEHGT